MKKEQGYIALISVLIINAVIGLIAVNTNILSMGESSMGLSKEQSSRAYYLANACGEEALENIKESISYGGKGSLSYEHGECEYNIIKEGGEKRTIEVVAEAPPITRKIRIALDRVEPTINIISWEDVADF